MPDEDPASEPDGCDLEVTDPVHDNDLAMFILSPTGDPEEIAAYAALFGTEVQA